MKNPQPKDPIHPSVGEVISEIGASAKSLIRSEINLARAEVKESIRHLSRHSARAAVFGALLIVSILPFMAFLVIGLGMLMGEKYWLSSLIVSAVFAAIGGPMTYREYHRIKEQDLSLPHTRESIQIGAESISEKAQEVKETASERVQDIREATKRRTS